MSFKKTVCFYFAVFLFLAAVLPSVFYVSDPYMLFHEHWFHKGKMINNLRIQNYGLIKYEPFDAVILGTSMFQNTSADEATKKLKHTYVNLSFPGGTYYERFLILKFILRTKKIKSVIMSLDYHFKDKYRTENTFYPSLYSEKPLGGKLSAYLTSKAVLCTLLNKGCDFIDKNVDRPTAWFDMKEYAYRFNGFDDWMKHWKEDKQIQTTFRQLLEGDEEYKTEYAEYKFIIDNFICRLFENKEISFSIIVPPYSILYWGKRKQTVKEMMKPYEYLVEKAKNHPNVKIHWFYDDAYVFDISKYMDLVHYGEPVNSRQIDAIQNGTHILDETNYKQKLKTFIEKVKAFDLDPYLERIRKETDIKA